MLYHVVNGANIIILAFLYIFTFLLCYGDIELNPGQKTFKPNYLSVCHWKLSSISAHYERNLKHTIPFINMTCKHDL